ncbi:ATP-dependent helicase [Dolichospermum sp. ST_con]|nr:ATP-dependent helicase [Dolichospermum sp. ST_con]MDD1418088.1 ATP-dependent helicase [Dolichospermum sp. ST_sed1]MDD1423365.1 ATP-dependent helicase [Dolichospermum sp. ST_sed9]MDD1430139.1 ATP-dependent helicase [Dolichospermum sp. ST_sed6]MDD1436142.1 ATP-dependent helicase [Dolichospermum sp. ST_sed10]MDD1439380.1 ATP-dependent helicase [Dolichospermum sp. ST_sed3]MDD1445204.1 ATP-dependent helicase [Dolichospermum sp. ST_sed8]MDD1455749.1 ATP-dependent helicase [Dolichospermum sp. ST
MTIHLSETQQKIVQHGNGALLVIAGPGTGKTRVLTERVRRLLTEDQGHFRILALTFTNKAANEMKERLREFPNINQRAFIGTLHSFCLEVLANRGKAVGIEGRPNILESNQDRKQILLQAVMDDPELKYELKNAGEPKQQNKLLTNWFEIIEKAKRNLQFPEMLTNPIERKVYEAYNEVLRTSNAVDFDDLLLLTYQLFTERPKIADFYRRLYRYICIDEAQDLNEVQYKVLLALCGIEYRNVMMVGDPKQAIFGWNGANPQYLDNFEEDFKAQKIEMLENFRSSQTVVNAAKSLDSKYQAEGKLPIIGELKFIGGENEKDEAILVLDYIKNLIDKGHPDVENPITWGSCALIGRTRYVLSSVENELINRGYPYYKEISPQDESESDLLKDFDLCMRIIANPRSHLHIGKLINRWNIDEQFASYKNFNNGLEILQSISKKISDEKQKAVLKAVEVMNWTGQSFDFIKAMNSLKEFANTLENSEEERALIIKDTEVWRNHWNIFLRSKPGGNPSLSSFLNHIALGTTQPANHEGISLLTIGKAKGLEFDVVIVMGMTEGTFPDYRAKNDAALEDEKHNIFVAVTRSKRILGFSYPKVKMMPWKEEKRQQQSRYLTILKSV